MKEAQKNLLNMTSAALFGKAFKPSADMNWQQVYDQIRRQSLVSLLFPLASDLDVPGDVMEPWTHERDRYLLNNAQIIGGHFAIQRLMDEADIPCLMLKGIASAKYYPDYLLRAFGDVDFLVPGDAYKKATELLKNKGFRFVNLHDKHRIYSRHDVIYELHRDIVGIPAAPAAGIFNEYFSGIFDEAVGFDHKGSCCMTPSHRHHCVILLLHTAEHIAKTGVGLRHICDWAAFVDKMTDSFFEDEMRPVLKEMGIWRFARVLTCLCTEYLGLGPRPWAGEVSDRYLADLIDDVFDSGEFGRIHEEAVAGGISPGASGADLVSPGTLRALLASLNRGARTVIPASADHSILLPAGWAYVTGRYLARMLTGKRTASEALENLVRLGKRAELTEEWRLFDREMDQVSTHSSIR